MVYDYRHEQHLIRMIHTMTGETQIKLNKNRQKS